LRRAPWCRSLLAHPLTPRERALSVEDQFDVSVNSRADGMYASNACRRMYYALMSQHVPWYEVPGFVPGSML
ncbi:MAG: hypothetical protein ACPIOQ_80800, partial [Promethearchaeia archaeon]